MNKYIKITLVLIISIIICIPSFAALFCYTVPMEDNTYNLSMFAEDGSDSPADDKGWTVYTSDKGDIKNLEPDGFGGFSGLDYAGQTFYFSRILNEELDNPTMRIGAVNRTVSVFLDNKMIYTDCPNLDNRIGYLSLPMLEFDRAEPVVISLPSNYKGRTLTIAQSSPVYSEKQDMSATEVYPSEVTLYCGYAYESTIISNTAKTVIPAAIFFAAGIILLAAFIIRAYSESISWELLIISASSFIKMCGILAEAPFFYQYFGLLPIDPIPLCLYISIALMIVFITIRAVRFRIAYIVSSVIQILSVFLYLATQLGWISVGDEIRTMFLFIPNQIAFAAITAVFVCSFMQWKNSSEFFKCFSKTAALLFGIFFSILLIGAAANIDYIKSLIDILKSEFLNASPNRILNIFWNICLISVITAVIKDSIEHISQKRAEISVLAEKSRLAMESYKNLQRQSDEIISIRHDTIKHYSTIRSMLEKVPQNVPDYLDTLIGNVQKIRVIVESENEMLNILLNGKLSAAIDMGIHIEIKRSQAPKSLPFTDVELCSLIINILDNAINAASKTKNPYIELDFHCKNNNFIFVCENSSLPQEKKAPEKEHGYGLKIIRQIMKEHKNMIRITISDNTFKISFAVQLSK